MKNSDFKTKIDAFWSWFDSNRSLIETVVAGDNHPKTQTIIEQFDHHILDLGRFKWLLENPRSGEFTFTLSPNKTAENYSKSRAIIADAPYYPNWNFFDHIQAVGIAPFEIYDAQMDIIVIDPQPWFFAFDENKNKRFDITIVQTNCAHIDIETREIAAEIAVSNLIGEALRIEKIENIFVTQDKSENKKHVFLPFLSLIKHI